MEALGEYLKEAREKLNLSIEKIAEDTHIMSKFIEAIEIEEFTAFPGEAYLKGFLRTYSEYLGINAEDVIRRYEKIKMVETPTPIEQLIPKPKFNFTPIIVIFVCVVLLVGLGFGAFYGVKSIIANAKAHSEANQDDTKIAKTYQEKRKAKEEAKKAKEEAKKAKEEAKKQIEIEEKKEDITELTNPVTQSKLKKSAIVKLMINDMECSFAIKELSPTVVISYGNDKDLYVIKDNTHKIDLNNDGKNDVEIVLNNWDKEFADFTFRTIDQTVVSTAKLGTYELIGDNPEVLVTKDVPEDITFTVNFSGYQFFRYKSDEKPSVENIYGDRDDNKSLSIKAKSYVVVWFTNASNATMLFPKFNNIVHKIESDNKVEIRLIKWERNSDGKYELVVSTIR